METSLRSTLTVPSQRDALDRVLTWAEQFQRKVVTTALDSISNEVWLSYQVALAEGFTNAVRHAHESLSPPPPVDLEVRLEERRLVLQIWDLGPPFDLERQLKERLEHPSPDPFPGGGFGLVIMHQAADELRYEREIGDSQGNRNCLTLIWDLSEGGS